MATDPLDLLTIDELAEARARTTELMSTGALNRHVNGHLVELLDSIDKTVTRKRAAEQLPKRHPVPAEPALAR